MDILEILTSDWFRWLVIGLFAVVAWAGWTRDVRRVYNVLRLLARKLEDAKVKMTPWSIAYPTLTSRHNGCDAEVFLTQGSQKFTPRTTFQASLRKPHPFSLTVRRGSSAKILGKTVGGQDIEIGDPKFDKAFLVQGKSEDGVKRMLSPEFKKALLWFKNLDPWVTVDGTVVEVEMRAIPTDGRQFERFLALGKLATDAAVRELG